MDKHDKIHSKVLADPDLREFLNAREKAVAADLISMAEAMIGSPSEDDLQKFVTRARETYSLPLPEDGPVHR